MKIAFVSYDFAEYCIHTVEGLAEKAEVELYLPEDLSEPFLDRLHPNIKFKPFKKPRLRQPFKQLALNRQLVKDIKAFNPDVVHLQQGHLWFNFALPFLNQYPLVTTIHNPRHHVGDVGGQKTPQWVFDFGFKRSKETIVHGAPLKNVVTTELGFSENSVHDVPHIVMGNDMNYTEIKETPNTLLFFGRIWPYKGLEFLIKAEPLIRKEIPEFKIVIAGEGEDFARYEAMMRSDSVNEANFEVHNRFVSDEERGEMFQRSAVIVLPYIEATQSGVIPLAYTFAKPVIATNVGALPAAVDDGVTGLLVEPEDIKGLAEACIKLLKDETLRMQMGQAAKHKVDTEQSAGAVAEKMLTVYKKAVGPKIQTRGVMTNA